MLLFSLFTLEAPFEALGTRMMLFFTFFSFLSGVMAGYMCSDLAKKEARLAVQVCACLALSLGIILSFASKREEPLWSRIANPALCCAGVIAGGVLHDKSRKLLV
jgi:hypothetical protein